ncbi:MAG: hypothetical protein OEV41_11545, partial [Gammaproteobacteria bacterium]|nr:hypothetical protein [Gammaproteobacteria bacterium]
MTGSPQEPDPDEPRYPASRVPATHLGRYRHHYLLGAAALLASLLLPQLVQTPDTPPAGDLLSVEEPPGDRDLALIEADHDATIVVKSPGDDHSGRLSPDEQWIAFVSRQSGFDELWVAATDGATERRLTRFDGATVRYPDWHRDGTRILITVQADAAERLYEVGIESGSVTEIGTGFLDVTTPRWVEGGWVAGCRDADAWGICFGDAAGTRKIADGYYRPAPAGLGNVYVVDDRGGFYNLSLADGSATKVLDGLPGRGRYGWEVDEGNLYFLARGEIDNTGRLMKVDLGGGEPETIYTGAMPVEDTTI